MAVFERITNMGCSHGAVSPCFANDDGRLDSARRLQRFAHRVDWRLAIEPDGK
jgi:hypothetical protein